MKVRIEFDSAHVIAIVERGNATALRRAGAYIRKAARNKVSQSEHASIPGTPPHTRRGLLKNSLLFGYDKQRKCVVIGPAENIIGTAMYPHEHGAVYHTRRYPKRPLMVPTLEGASSKLPKLWENSVK